VANGQGVPGSAAYVRGNKTRVLGLKNYGDTNWWYADDPQAVPAEWTPAASSEVQLVALINAHSVNSGVRYSGSGGFFHYTWQVNLREALTGRLVASQDFAGDNIAPSTITGYPVPTANDQATIVPAFRAWLSTYVQ
jgi:hypothetical protein